MLYRFSNRLAETPREIPELLEPRMFPPSLSFALRGERQPELGRASLLRFRFLGAEFEAATVRLVSLGRVRAQSFGAVSVPARSTNGTSKRERTAMKDIMKSVKRFLVSEDGPTAVEYAVMLALIVIVCLTAIQAIGTNANTKFGQVRDALT